MKRGDSGPVVYASESDNIVDLFLHRFIQKRLGSFLRIHDGPNTGDSCLIATLCTTATNSSYADLWIRPPGITVPLNSISKSSANMLPPFLAMTRATSRFKSLMVVSRRHIDAPHSRRLVFFCMSFKRPWGLVSSFIGVDYEDELSQTAHVTSKKTTPESIDLKIYCFRCDIRKGWLSRISVCSARE